MEKLWLLMHFVRNDKESLKKARILFLHSIKLMIKKTKKRFVCERKISFSIYFRIKLPDCI